MFVKTVETVNKGAGNLIEKRKHIRETLMTKPGFLDAGRDAEMQRLLKKIIHQFF